MENSMEDKKISRNIFHETGDTGLNQSSGWVYEDLVPILRWPRAGKIYQEMSNNDPVVFSILMAARQLFKRSTWDVLPASQDAEDQAAAEFLQSCMEDMDNTWNSFIDDLLSFFTYGWSYMEIVYKKRDDGRIGWKKIIGRSQTSLAGWEFDEYGTVKGMYQSTNDRGDVYIPLTKAMLFRTTTVRNNPEGQSFLRGAYRSWYFKKHLEEIEGIGIERDLAGLPVITTPEGLDLSDTTNPQVAAIRNEALALVSSIRRDSNEGVVLGSGWQLQLLSSGGSTIDTNSIINRYDNRIAITMLSDIVMMGGDKVGSFALANTKERLLISSLNAILSDVTAILNAQAVKYLFDLNTFNITNYPKIVTTQISNIEISDLGQFIQNLTASNMQLFPDRNLENHLRRAANLPEVPEDFEYTSQTQQTEQMQQTKQQIRREERKNQRFPDESNNTGTE